MSNKWSERIGNTIAINPGSGELLHAVICKIDEEGNIAYTKHSIFGELVIDK